MRYYTIRPCRWCGNPVQGVCEGDDISMCCSRDICSKKEDKTPLSNKTKPKKTLTDRQFKHQIYLDSRGY